MDINVLTPIDDLIGESRAETKLVLQMWSAAESYLESHAWAYPIHQSWYGDGVPGLFGVFLIEVEILGSSDRYLWVVTGDLPSAYFVIDDAPTPLVALRTYVELMRDWIVAVRTGSGFEEVFPVRAPREESYAAMLESRLGFIERELLNPAGV